MQKCAKITASRIQEIDWLPLQSSADIDRRGLVSLEVFVYDFAHNIYRMIMSLAKCSPRTVSFNEVLHLTQQKLRFLSRDL